MYIQLEVNIYDTLTLPCDFNNYIGSSLSHIISIVEESPMNRSTVNFHANNSTRDMVHISLCFLLSFSWSVAYIIYNNRHNERYNMQYTNVSLTFHHSHAIREE